MSVYDSNDNWRVGLNVNFSFGVDPKSKQIFNESSTNVKHRCFDGTSF